METVQLREILSAIDLRNSKTDITATLTARKVKELEFHNEHRDLSKNANLPQDTYELLHGNKKYYSTVQLSSEYVQEWVKKNAPGKIFLDYACGNGLNAIQAAKYGASLAIGLDISDISVSNARAAAEAAGVGSRCVFIQGDCENTGLPENSIDLIICSGMLHHLDLSYAFPELRRILRPGGKLLGIEALDYNPLIKAYRMATPSMRTDWEKNHILSMKDIRFARRFFEVGEMRFWHLFSIFAAYFKGSQALQKSLLAILNTLDRFVLSIPLVKLLAWQFTFELRKPKE